ncbi:LysR family transcriptional regulator [Limnohabitans sp.]|uniref:LysR family transcriptional regulator n=1 Tax=Limnohabitans sp. TaxID=1907725 RepID=UPI0025BD926E|nr:LysR family transcriptional regulator [Limnohabitans sp.]
MELHQIRAFVTVARLGHLTKAAQVLCVTQPAVTAQVKALESSLGVALFERSSGRMSLTREGEALLPKAESVLSASGQLQGAARQMQGQVSGQIELGVPGEQPGFLRLGELSAAVQRDLPLVELHIRTHASGSMLDRLRGGALTAALVIASHPPRDLHWQSLRSVRYRVVVPTRLCAQMQRGGWKTLAALPWMDGPLDSPSHLMLRQLFEQQGLAPNVALRTEDTAALDTLVASGAGCALLREELALPGVERGEWMVWGHAQVDAQLFFCTAIESVSDPLVVALTSVVVSNWA